MSDKQSDRTADGSSAGSLTEAVKSDPKRNAEDAKRLFGSPHRQDAEEPAREEKRSDSTVQDPLVTAANNPPG